MDMAAVAASFYILLQILWAASKFWAAAQNFLFDKQSLCIAD